MASMTGAFVLSGPLSYPYFLDGLQLSGLSLFRVLVCSTIMLPVHPINDQRGYRWDKYT